MALPPAICGIVTPLCWRSWDWALCLHPDRNFPEYVGGIRDGFRVGFQYEHCDIRFLLNTCELGRVLNPFSSPPILLQISSFGVIPKRHQTNKWRLIMDLSSPHSVNDGIDGTHCSFNYISLEWVVRSMGTSHIFHYMDNFILVRPANSPACKQNLHLLMQTCSNLGVIMANEKTEGPCTRLTVLGIQVTTSQ